MYIYDPRGDDTDGSDFYSADDFDEDFFDTEPETCPDCAGRPRRNQFNCETCGREWS